MENDKSLLEGIISDYYNSVEDSFLYRLKNDLKISISVLIFSLSVFFLIINIIPIVPGLSKNYFLFLFEILKEKTTLPLNQFNFWIKWGLGTLFSLLLLGITYLYYKFWDIRETKKALRTCLKFSN